MRTQEAKRALFDQTKKLSDLIDLALNDLEEIRSNATYIIDMDVWHRPIDQGKCRVCLAGAVMANRLGLTPDEEFSHHMEWSEEDRKKFTRLNWARSGIVSGMHLYNVTPYKKDPEQFILDVRAMANDLRAKGK